MIALIERPLSALHALLVTAAVVVTGAAYCVIYNGAAGIIEPPLVALAWGLINLAPWLLAFEAAKSATTSLDIRHGAFWGRVAAILVGAVALSLLVEQAIGPVPDPFAFRLVRRLPGAALVVALLLGGRTLRAVRLRYAAAAGTTPGTDLPVPPEMIERVTSAGNYVELHIAGRQILCRLTMRRAHALLAERGFVRIHRTALVNRHQIAKVIVGKSRDEVLMRDGCRLSVGGRYRAALADLR